MSKYPNPADAFDEGRFLSGDKDLPKADKPKPKTEKKPTKKKECSPCGQKSLTGSTYNG